MPPIRYLSLDVGSKRIGVAVSDELFRQALAVRPGRPNAGPHRHLGPFIRPAPDIPGVEFAVLYDSARELVLLERWAPGISIAVPIPGGIELLVLDGGFTEDGEEFTQYSWLRLPAGSTLQAAAGPQGCRLWVKSGHLSHEPRSPASPKDTAR